jgi:4-hydroxy-tetrahydrodipicolinate reductase
MMNIALIGYGKMGKEIEHISSKRNVAIKKIFTEKNNAKGSGLTKRSLKNVDVCIDFSMPSAAFRNISAAAECGTNIVVGTTGWYDKLPEVNKLVRSREIGVLYSPNFSLGMNIFSHVLRSSLLYLDKFDLYDIAVREIHHTAKADSPSGTALALGEIILDHVRSKKEIVSNSLHKKIQPSQLHISATRVGNIVGNHSVIFDSESDTIELTHSAKNRGGFALGALLAAEWLNGKKGLFTMNDVITSL